MGLTALLPLRRKALFTIFSNAFRTQEWSQIARDDVPRLRLTPALISFFGWLVGAVRGQSIVRGLRSALQSCRLSSRKLLPTGGTRLDELYYDTGDSIYTQMIRTVILGVSGVNPGYNQLFA
jgi:hypothetical protein